MTQDEIIRMARDAGLGTALCHNSIDGDRIWIEGADWHDEVERFANLVAAHEREKLKAPHECQTEGEKTAFAFGWFKAIEKIESAVLAEREACAKVCEQIERRKWEILTQGGKLEGLSPRDCAAAIRARSQALG